MMGLSCLNKQSPTDKWRRIFKGFDIDNDGFINRKDFLRIFRAHYALTKAMTAELVANMEDECDEEELRALAMSIQPLSSSFRQSPIDGLPRRTG